MADARKPNESSRHISEWRESVPALEVPLSISHCHEDELLSWLQYPMEDSFDKNYCSEEPAPKGPKSHSDIVDDAFSNLTLREATYTWGIPGFPDTNKGEKILAANMAMAMGAQRAAGLLSQSGVDTFNKVRTNAQPHAAKSVHNHVTEQTSGSVSNVHKVEKPGFSCQNDTRPNFSLFSRVGGVTGMRSEQAPYDSLQATQRVNLGLTRHAGGISSDNQTGRVATRTSQAQSPLLKNVEQSSTASDTPMIMKEFPPMSLFQSRATKGTGMGFSRLPSQHRMKFGTSNEFTKETDSEFTTPAFASSEMEAKAIGLTTHAMTTSGALASQRGLLFQSVPAASSGLASGASAGLSGKRIRAEMETKHLVSQEDPSFGSASTVITDMDSRRQSKLARCASETNVRLVDSRILVCTTDHESKASCPVRTRSEIITLDSQLHETVGMGDAFIATPSRAWGDGTSKSVTEAADFSTKRASLFYGNSEIECKDFKDGNLLQGHVIGKGPQAADIQTFERKSGATGKRSR